MDLGHSFLSFCWLSMQICMAELIKGELWPRSHWNTYRLPVKWIAYILYATLTCHVTTPPALLFTTRRREKGINAPKSSTGWCPPASRTCQCFWFAALLSTAGPASSQCSPPPGGWTSCSTCCVQTRAGRICKTLVTLESNQGCFALISVD